MQPDHEDAAPTKGLSSTQHAFYRPLDSAAREIRVVQLHPGQRSDPVSASLVYASLSIPDRASQDWTDNPVPTESTTPYEAISYTWDEIPKHLPMCVNGYEVSTPASAVEVLRVFRHVLTPRLLWIDALCINQDDLGERASQVAFMGDIYEAALGTLVWLGDEDDNTPSALHACRRVVQRLSVPSILEGGWLEGVRNIREVDDMQVTAAEKASMLAIYNRRWFSRAWVLQEAALSRSCTCYIGSLTIEWRDLMFATRWLAFTSATDPMERSLPEAVMPATMVGVMVEFRHKARRSQTPLSLLLATTCFLRSSDPRDRIYSLLSLSRWRDPEHQRRVGLYPDYRKSFHQCAGDAVRCAIFENRTGIEALNILNGEVFGEAKFADTESEPWPSWIRCSSMTRHFDITRVLTSSGYSAGTRIRQDDELVDVTTRKAGQDFNILSLRGVTVGLVSNFTNQISGSTIGEALGAMVDHFESLHNMPAFCAGDRDDDGPITADDERFDEIIEVWFIDPNDGTRKTWNRRSRAGELWERIRRIIADRKIFRTADGRMGIGPVGLEQGDRIVVLFGSKLPFVIGDRGYGDVLIGACLVRGIMEGQAVEDTEAARRQSQIFHLH